MGIIENNTLIFVIDVQEKLVNAVFNKDLLLKKTEILIETAKILNLPILITEQYPKGLGSTVFNIENNIGKYEKTSFSALDEEEVFNVIESNNFQKIVLFGIETHICVYQTARDLIKKGYDVTIISDACGSRKETEYLQAIECLKTLGANIKTTEMFVFETLKTSKHPKFKEIQSLIK